ncbi:MAG TPA: hypothetical protein VMM78_09810 [Thermomicrobiales bacterium]|nr:hypothetical protein [Thermomicrobiales bacterium]
MGEVGWGITFLLGMSVIIASVLNLILWQVMMTRRVTEEARIKAASETAYRDIAERATAAQETTGQQLNELRAHMADLRARVGDIERMMREVE